MTDYSNTFSPSDATNPIPTRIIGIEITEETVRGKEELMMFVPSGGYYDLPSVDRWGAQRCFIVTFHTNHGDVQGRVYSNF